MIVDFTDKDILNLDDTKSGLSMVKTFGEILLDPKQGKNYSQIRRYEIARTATLEKKISLLSEDYDMCMDIISKTEMWGPLITGQLLIELKKAKTKEE